MSLLSTDQQNQSESYVPVDISADIPGLQELAASIDKQERHASNLNNHSARPEDPFIESSKPARRGKLFYGSFLLVASGTLFGGAALFSPNGGESTSGDILTDDVRSGPFSILVTESGTIDSQKNMTLSSQVEWKTSIINLVPEGQRVKEGEILCELDSAKLWEELKEHEILLDEANAQFKQSEKEIAIQIAVNESNIDKAQLNSKLAQLDIEKYENGELPQENLRTQSKITLAQKDLARAQEDYDFTRRMSKKGYKSQADLEAAQLAVTKARISLNVAQETQKVFEKYTSTRTMAALEAHVLETKGRLKRVKRSAEAALLQAKIRSASYARKVKRRQAHVDRLRQNIEACTIRAPQAGEVVYANSGAKRRSNPKPIEIGAEIQYRQEIIKLPDLTRMKVDARVHESKISQVKPGLPVNIRVDAYPDILFQGTVKHVSSVPLSGSWPNYDLKEYAVVVLIDDENEDVSKLRPGLTSEIEIQVEQRDAVLQVPVQAVVGVGGKKFAYVMTNHGPERRSLSIGMTNASAVEVKAGLTQGEQAILNPRTRFADELAELTEKAAQAELEND